MKNIFKIGVLAGVLLLTGCNKFLDVVPKTQSPQDVLFDTQAGFKDALTGLYIQLKDNQIYGNQLTYGAIENLVSSWDVEAQSTAERIGLFDYGHTGVEQRFSSIFGKLYGTIANTNALLGKIDEQRTIFRDENLYRTIKGEALAIRAYLHFDVLRLYGPVPLDIDPSVRLPYVTELSTDVNQSISYDAFLSNVLQDLSDAEELLKDIDPILQFNIPELRGDFGAYNVFNELDEFMAYRYLRFNYYAVKGLQARVHLWNGDNLEAYSAAKAVIDAVDRNGNKIYRLGTGADFSGTAPNFVLTPEHIVGLYDFQMYKKYADIFANGSVRKGPSAVLITTQLYGNTGVDHRESSLWEVVTQNNGAQMNIIRKYKVVESPINLNVDYKQIPLIRLSEMYLIAAEAATLSEGQTYWNDFLASRNLTSTALDADVEQKRLMIVREYRKEFYAEGQGFYAYKRINAPKTAIVFVPGAATVNYVVPLPLLETVNLD